METGKNYGILNAGYFALRTLRIEKMFAFWGQDLDKNTNPFGNFYFVTEIFTYEWHTQS